MTETPDARLQRRLEQLRRRRASMSADRAAFDARRRRGLTARHKTKLAHLTELSAADGAEAPKEEPRPQDTNNEAA